MAAPQNADQIEEPSSFIQTPKQLVAVILLAFTIPVILIVLLATLASTGRFDADHPAMSDEAIAQRIKPVGKVLLADAAGAGAKGAKSGEEVYKQVCAACHATGVLNAPKVGDKAAWGKLIPQGLDQLTADAIKGIRQMPPRGGNPELSDIEVKRAVVLMANQSGANWKEPEAPAAAPPAAPAVAAAAPAAAPPAAAPAGAPAPSAAAAPTAPAGKPAAADGKAIYEKVCAVCHVAGVAGAPKTGDKAAWAPRIKQGMDALYAASIKGKGAMPPKGGAAQLSDAEIKAAVDHLVGLAK